METEDPVKVGTHSPALSQPLIQMGMPMHPGDLDQRARVADVALSLAALQTEVAVLNAGLTTFRMAMIIQTEEYQKYADKNAKQVLDIASARIAELASKVDRLAELEIARIEQMSVLLEQMDTMCAAFNLHVNDQREVLERLEYTVTMIPETYLMTRLWRQLQRIWS